MITPFSEDRAVGRLPKGTYDPNTSSDDLGHLRCRHKDVRAIIQACRNIPMAIERLYAYVTTSRYSHNPPYMDVTPLPRQKDEPWLSYCQRTLDECLYALDRFPPPRELYHNMLDYYGHAPEDVNGFNIYNFTKFHFTFNDNETDVYKFGNYEEYRDLEKLSGVEVELIALAQSADVQKQVQRTRIYDECNVLSDEYTPGIIFDISGSERIAFNDKLSAIAAKGYRYGIINEDKQTGIDTYVILPSDDLFAVLEYRKTHAPNHNLSNADILAKMRSLHMRYGIDRFYGAGRDWIIFMFENFVGSAMPLVEELYEFCPDCIDQGFETKEKLANWLERCNGFVTLWWD